MIKFANGMLMGVVILGFFLLATNHWERPYKTIARLEAERDSAKEKFWDVSETRTFNRNRVGILDARHLWDDGERYTGWGGFYDWPLEICRVDKDDNSYSWLIYTDSIKRWPPDTLKTKPMKRD